MALAMKRVSSLTRRFFNELTAEARHCQNAGLLNHWQCVMTRSQNPRFRRSSVRGFSLIELMIVLGVIVTITAIAAPNLMDRVRDGQVQEAAETVREVVAETRTFAIDAGVDYHFHFEIGGQSVVAIPSEQEPSAGNSLDSDDQTADFRAWANEVPDTIFLRNNADDTSGGGSLEPADFGNLPNSGELAQKTWSDPIVFHFDGTAEDQSFRVMDAEGRASTVTVRGLTGSVRISPVFTMEENK
jgi:prepilin-type N-terminal cleavage/methylation domain-containing protein